MAFRSGISFASAQYVEPGEVDGIVHWGYHFQYRTDNILINVVILTSDDICEDQLGIEDELIEQLDDAQVVADDVGLSDVSLTQMEQIEEAESVLEAWAEQNCEAVIREILRATCVDNHDARMTLQQLLHPPIINLQLKTVDGKVTVIRYGDSPPWPDSVQLDRYRDGKVELPLEGRSVPSYWSFDVEIDDEDGMPLVIVDGELLHCKVNIFSDVMTRELKTYARIDAAGLRNVRVPNLRGYVKDGPGDEIVAFLLSHIATKYSNLDMAMDGHIWVDLDEQDDMPDLARRKKWAHQIQDTLKQLHEHDIIWGDVKPANILIDVDDNAWVLDFNGGFTYPWKTPEEAETKEGDCRAIERIVQYLESGNRPDDPDQLYA